MKGLVNAVSTTTKKADNKAIDSAIITKKVEDAIDLAPTATGETIKVPGGPPGGNGRPPGRNGNSPGGNGESPGGNGDPSKIFWGSWTDYNKVKVNGREYAKVGDRLYTQHAVERMQPSGMRYTRESAGGRVGASRIYEAGQKDYGRSISPNYIEEVIAKGDLIDSPIVNGVQRQVWRSGTVEVVTEKNGQIVITVMNK